MLLPKLVTTLKTYDREQFLRDLTAGVIVGIVALPLAIAFAIASGVTPEQGLYTAIVAGFLISLLGGSRVQIGGPTGAFVVIVYSIVQRYGYDGLALATMMAGVILVVLGAARMGRTIKFIPFPVTIGFTTGIALIIFTSQIKDLLGLRMGPVPADFVDKLRVYWAHIGSMNPSAAAVALLTLAIMAVWPRISRRIPGPFAALLLVSMVVRAIGLDVETIGTRFGVIHAALPMPALPFHATTLQWTDLRALIQPAIAIALLAAIESLLSAVVADGMIGSRHRSNAELVAQGVANFISPLFGGIPATGAIARTATNVKNGGRTPVAGLVHAVTLLLIVLFFGRWVGFIPMAVLAAILVVVAWHMSEWRTFIAEARGAPRSDVLVMLATFGLTVMVDLTVAIEVGMVLAAFLFMKRMAEVTNVSVITGALGDESDDGDANAAFRRQIPADVQVYEINGPFFFGAAETFKETVGIVADPPKVLIIRMRNVPAIDSTAMRALRELHRRSAAQGTLLLLSDVHAQPMIAMERSFLLDEIGKGNIFANIGDALNGAREHLGLAAAGPARFATSDTDR
ncbi:MAG TPA: sulfate permease [Gemmatimonadales bacterium]